MRKLFDYVKNNKKIIIAVALLIVLIFAVFLINKSNKPSSTTAALTEKSATEVKLCDILMSIDGVGEADVMINESENGILGVIIVCDGADNIMVRNDILNAVSTALGVQKSAIAIYSMN